MKDFVGYRCLTCHRFWLEPIEQQYLKYDYRSPACGHENIDSLNQFKDKKGLIHFNSKKGRDWTQ